jgi:repressor of nif and glnA expression
MRNMTWRNATLKVLRDAKKPMHYADIAQAIIDRGYRERRSNTRRYSCRNHLAAPPERS